MRAGEADHGHSIHAREERLFTAPIPALVILAALVCEFILFVGISLGFVSALYAAAVWGGWV